MNKSARSSPAVRERVVRMVFEHQGEYGSRWAALRRLPRRARRDAELAAAIGRVHGENPSVYGARKVWRQMPREGIAVAPGARQSGECDRGACRGSGAV